ncbi:MAG: hypothetical protein LBJ44_05030 [Propionibacteriaceae bacterium]|jgi:hypothetical protein|nr:hypothetical protein [Propionibacteriaceae bacterium]
MTESTPTQSTNVPYLDEHGKPQTAKNVTVLNGSSTLLDESQGGWYVAIGVFTIPNRIKVKGNVHLILSDYARLLAQQGITVIAHYGAASDSLTIYAQSTGLVMGTLEANGDMGHGDKDRWAAGIGGIINEDGGGNQSGKITINGGKVTVVGGHFGAGIGGVYSGSGGEITINNGIVTATGGTLASGIGGGHLGDGGTIVINGGTINTTGDYNGAGIGAGRQNSGGNVTITGGTVNATGGHQAAGIGGGQFGANGGTLVITGGTITAAGGDFGAGIGGGVAYEDGQGIGAKVTISGGTVTATGGKEAAGIGGGSKGPGGTTTITGGTVTARSTSGGTGIGAGFHAFGGETTIAGGNVIASGNWAAILSDAAALTMKAYKYKTNTEPRVPPGDYTYYHAGGTDKPLVLSPYYRYTEVAQITD